MPRKVLPARPASGKSVTIHLIDVGAQAYADCALCQFGDITVLIDGAHAVNATPSVGHRSVPDQLAGILGQPADALHVDLLIVSHTHSDHYGCLPTLVGAKTLHADWALIADRDLGWGKIAGETDALMDAADPRAQRLMDLFREDFPPDDEVRPLSDFALDRVSDQDVYSQFVTDLENGGGTVVSYADGPDAGGDLKKLLAHFQTLGLTINLLGPSRAQLVECARGLAQGLGLVTDFLRVNTPPASVDMVADFDTVLQDAQSKLARGGNFVNLQSLITIFEYQGRKFLFSGDMQTEDPATKYSHIPISAVLKSELRKLRQQMMASAPYDFVKLGHHGSFNACSDELLNAYRDTKDFGISVGEFSPTHPDPDKVLPLLIARKKTIKWVRTDYNRLCGFQYHASAAGVPFKETGPLNDTDKNKYDLGQRLSGAGGGPGDLFAESLPGAAPAGVSTGDTAKLQARIPFAGAYIDFQLTVSSPGAAARTRISSGSKQPDSGSDQPAPGSTPALPASSVTPPNLAGGRTLPKLLFVTSRDQLANNVGKLEAQAALDAIRQRGHLLVDDLPSGLKLSDTSETLDRVRQQLAAASDVRGIVLLGGYDVVPSRQLNTLPEGEEQHVADVEDPDKWIIWCDDEYGGLPNNGKLAYYSLPVSRVPDQHYAPFFYSTLQAPGPSGTLCSGLRNLLRPFATQVSPNFKDRTALYVSSPVVYTDGTDLSAEYVYFMLHGDALDSMEYVGETKEREPLRAFRIDNVPGTAGAVVFAGCCWGALIGSTPAAFALPNQPIGVKGRDSSIALRFLAKGARAFVGCTGAHYSPGDGQPAASAGGPMHIAFWKYCLDPSIPGPAEALRRAKIDYLAGMPYLPDVASSVTVNSKILNQFTCLGLGW